MGDNQYRLRRLNDGQKLIISQPDGEGGRRTVKAALPDNFGAAVGSTFTDPFNNNVSAGRFDDIATKASAYLGFSRKMGARVTSVFYDGPEPTEISFELAFESYYSAYDEVVVPVQKLMLMSVGTEKDAEDLRQFAEANGYSNDVIDQFFSKVSESFAGDLVKVIQGPALCKLKFGKTMTFKRCYVSSVAPSFSNVLDNEFYPTSATCAVTVKIERNPTAEDILVMFGKEGN